MKKSKVSKVKETIKMQPERLLELEEAKRKRETLHNDRKWIVKNQIGFLCWKYYSLNDHLDRSIIDDLKQDLTLYWLANSTMIIQEYRQAVRRYRVKNNGKRLSFRLSFIEN